ncbi:transmembrane protein 45B-like [Oppia nitens]|uniref:transmembrane protein 45B-like n=1 Tax=Oppia nitens TaxID=1686743 RepID=UPI0023DCCC6D|nr:transmembrane protein 45B-like [Oppia nitens]
MGSFEGHLLPGTFFLLFGIWWTVVIFDRYFRSLVNSALTKRSQVFKCRTSYTKYESYIKIISTIIGIVLEYWTALDKNYRFTHTGIIELMIHNGYPLPKGCDYLSLSLAIFAEGLLFYFHLHGRTSLDIHVHTLLIISIILSLISVLIEWIYRYHFLSAFCRTVCTLLQGFWFYTVGFILYPPFSQSPVGESHGKQMLITALFCWEIAAIIVLMSFIGSVFYCKNRKILQTNEYSVNYRLCESNVDFKCLVNDTNDKDFNENESHKLSSNGIKSSINHKYSTIVTSDDEI